MTDSTSENHYEVLEADENATQEEIKAAYKKQAKELHPDQFEGVKEWVRLEATERFKKVNAAYDVLKDPRKRAGYDLKLRREREATGHDTTREQERRQQARWEEEHRTEQAEQRRREREERQRYEREERERQERREHEEQQRYEAEAKQRAEEGWGAWQEAGDGNGTQWEEGAEDRRDGWEETEEQDEGGHEQSRPPVQGRPGSVLVLAVRTAERIPKAVHLMCGSMLSGLGWVLATLTIGPGGSSAGVLLILACLGLIPIAARVLWIEGVSNLSKPSMVLVALGGGIPMLLITSILPGVWPVLLLGSVAWAVVMLTATIGRRHGVRR